VGRRDRVGEEGEGRSMIIAGHEYARACRHCGVLILNGTTCCRSCAREGMDVGVPTSVHEEAARTVYVVTKIVEADR
jgi:hypothetical protein